MPLRTQREGSSKLARDLSPGRTLAWMRAGTERFEAAVRHLDPGAVTAPTRLSGWHRGYLVTHVARNADALRNLLTWARTGVETPMYPNAERRASQIEAGAGRPLAEQVADLLRADATLAEAVSTMPGEAWTASVRTAQGRQVPAAEVPWMRTREVWVHGVDLGTGCAFDDQPVDLTEALLTDVITVLTRRPGVPALVLVATDGQGELTLHGQGHPVRVTGSRTRLLGWLTGREAGDALGADPRPLPPLPAWL
jgi:maleylpyruvate isomerase